MGFSSGLTLQMDLIVLRNSIFCHSACTLCPSLGPDCSQRGPYQQHSGCGIEQLSSASDQTTRKSDTERTGVRRRRRREWQRGRRVQDKILRCFHGIVVMHPPTQTHTRTSCVHLFMHAEVHKICLTHAYTIITHECAHCVKCASKPIDGAPSGEGFIRSNFQCYLLVLGANAQIELFLSTR